MPKQHDVEAPKQAQRRRRSTSPRHALVLSRSGSVNGMMSRPRSERSRRFSHFANRERENLDRAHGAVGAVRPMVKSFGAAAADGWRECGRDGASRRGRQRCRRCVARSCSVRGGQTYAILSTDAAARRRGLEYRRSTMLKCRSSTMLKHRSKRKGGVVALLHGTRRCCPAQDRSMG